MEYVQRAVNKKGHLMYDRVHLADYGKTMCGKELGGMWFVTGDEDKIKKEVTCPICRRWQTKKAD